MLAGYGEIIFGQYVVIKLFATNAELQIILVQILLSLYKCMVKGYKTMETQLKSGRKQLNDCH